MLQYYVLLDLSFYVMSWCHTKYCSVNWSFMKRVRQPDIYDKKMFHSFMLCSVGILHSEILHTLYTEMLDGNNMWSLKWGVEAVFRWRQKKYVIHESQIWSLHGREIGEPLESNENLDGILVAFFCTHVHTHTI